MRLPTVSIVTPSFNQGQFLEETIQSVLSQDYDGLEYFVIDGGSTDNSVDIIKKHEDRLTYWVSEPDRGQSHAINKGFGRASGEILAWLCSDDTYYPGTLNTVGRFFRQHPEVDVIYGDATAIDENSHVFAATRSLGFSLLGLLSRGTTIPQPASFFRRSILDQVGSIDEAIDYCMDYEFYVRVAIAGFKFERIPQTLATYRYHAASKTVSGKSENNRHNEAMEQHQAKYAQGRYSVNTLKMAFRLFKLKRMLFNIDRYWIYRSHYWQQLAKKKKINI